MIWKPQKILFCIQKKTREERKQKKNRFFYMLSMTDSEKTFLHWGIINMNKSTRNLANIIEMKNLGKKMSNSYLTLYVLMQWHGTTIKYTFKSENLGKCLNR